MSPNRYFKGDHRSFDPESEDFRTCVDIELDFNRSSSPLKSKKKVGASVAYGLNKKARHQETASHEGIIIQQLDAELGEVAFHIKHAVGNPLTTAPDINYEVHGWVCKNGMFDLIGFHDQSPNHEVYMQKDKGNRWIPIHQSRSQGLVFLSGVTAFQYWRFSNFL